ncbi:MAG: hypothetical protein PUH03_02270 [bacterium]|nr:hypothetical protein [bacterium]MDY2830983.1 hypothetical protein [Alphaproteobacteria bacterium]
MVKYLCKKEASTYLKNELGISISDKTLSKYITTGGGPEYFKFGWRVVYTVETLTEWVNSKMSKPLRGSFEEEKYNYNNFKVQSIYGGNNDE